jgi:hypothetical protein
MTRKSRPPHERRQHARHAVDLPANVTIGGARVPCRLADISGGGALISPAREIELGAKVELDLPGTGTVAATVVRLTGTHVGLMFPGVVVIAPLLRQAA